jgi:hypothetical protein
MARRYAARVNTAYGEKHALQGTYSPQRPENTIGRPVGGTMHSYTRWRLRRAVRTALWWLVLCLMPALTVLIAALSP